MKREKKIVTKNSPTRYGVHFFLHDQGIRKFRRIDTFIHICLCDDFCIPKMFNILLFGFFCSLQVSVLFQSNWTRLYRFLFCFVRMILKPNKAASHAKSSTITTKSETFAFAMNHLQWYYMECKKTRDGYDNEQDQQLSPVTQAENAVGKGCVHISRVIMKNK